jgi:hypothetical protein
MSVADENESDIDDEVQLTDDQYVGASFSKTPSPLTEPHLIFLSSCSCSKICFWIESFTSSRKWD